MRKPFLRVAHDPGEFLRGVKNGNHPKPKQPRRDDFFPGCINVAGAIAASKAAFAAAQTAVGT